MDPILLVILLGFGIPCVIMLAVIVGNCLADTDWWEDHGVNILAAIIRPFYTLAQTLWSFRSKTARRRLKSKRQAWRAEKARAEAQEQRKAVLRSRLEMEIEWLVRALDLDASKYRYSEMSMQEMRNNRRLMNESFKRTFNLTSKRSSMEKEMVMAEMRLGEHYDRFMAERMLCDPPEEEW